MYLPKKNEDLCVLKDLDMKVYGRIIHNGYEAETAQTSISGRIDKHSAVYPYTGVSFILNAALTQATT